MDNKLALLGGPSVVPENQPKDALFKWPIITEEDEAAALDVIRNNTYSNTGITMQFEEEFAEWIGRKYAVAYCNGTMSLAAAMFAIGLGAGDEIICPTKTYWASITQASTFGAAAVFCNIDENLVIDPNDIERCISPRTKAIMVVHYCSYPADMDAIMAIAKKHNLKVIEDVSHAQGGLYKGKRLGTFGDIAAMSLMSQKTFAAGELGIVVTDNRECYERALAYGHYERNSPKYIVETEYLKGYTGIALGGVKGRPNQLCSALARVQLKYFDERCAVIRKAMNYYLDQIDQIDGLQAIRVDESTGSNMAGFYGVMIRYNPEKFGGLPVAKFAEAVRSETHNYCYAGGNFPLHTHNFFKTFDFMNAGKPSRIAYNDRDVRELDDACKPSEITNAFNTVCFVKFDKEWIDLYVKAFQKVAANYQQLLDDERNKEAKQSGRWFGLKDE